MQRTKNTDRIESEEIRGLVKYPITNNPKLGTRNK